MDKGPCTDVWNLHILIDKGDNPQPEPFTFLALPFPNKIQNKNPNRLLDRSHRTDRISFPEYLVLWLFCISAAA